MAGQTVILRGDTQRRFAHTIIDQAPMDSVVQISGPKRSNPQNRKMWAVLADIARAKPGGLDYPRETWKGLMMQACGHEVKYIEGLTGDPFPIDLRSSKLTKDQMADLITFAIKWGDERGVVWSREAQE